MGRPANTPQPTQGWSISQVAKRTGVNESTLRMWETRHAFPDPVRLDNGHRSYSDDDVRLVTLVAGWQAEGLRLDVAIERARAAETATGPGARSVFGALRRAHPGVAIRALRKETLIGVSWAIEDELRATAGHAHVFGAFENAHNFEAAAGRWTALAEVTASTYVFADFRRTDAAIRSGRPCRVRLPADHPMRREWAVVCDGVELPVALSAWERPGQEQVVDGDRLFETVWTVDPNAVRTAARACADVALSVDAPGADRVVAALAAPPTVSRLDPAAVAALVTRILAYVDGEVGRSR